MSRYFSYYPFTLYTNQQVRDITRRNKVISDIFRSPYVFLPYTVLEGEKPETIALYYYGSVDDAWLVLLPNDITDPYYQWPLDSENLNQYIIEKYSDVSNQSGFDVVRWSQDLTRTDNIVYYYKSIPETDRIIRISPDSRLVQDRPEDWIPIRVYEYENQINENKREIFLVDKLYRNQIVEEFRRALR
jgi:hypothetical protein